MAIYNDLDSFYNDLEDEIMLSLVEVADDVKKAMEDYIENEIYGSYDPFVYERTNAFKNSVKIEPVEFSNNKYSIRIYISNEEHIDTPQWRDSVMTYSQIADMFASGNGYGRNGVKYDVISETQKEEVKKAIKELLNHLKTKFDIL